MGSGVSGGGVSPCRLLHRDHPRRGLPNLQPQLPLLEVGNADAHPRVWLGGPPGLGGDPAPRRCSIHAGGHHGVSAGLRAPSPGPRPPGVHLVRAPGAWGVCPLTPPRRQTRPYYPLVGSPCQQQRAVGRAAPHSVPQRALLAPYVSRKHSTVVPASGQVGWCCRGRGPPLQTPGDPATSPTPLLGRVGSHLPSAAAPLPPAGPSRSLRQAVWQHQGAEKGAPGPPPAALGQNHNCFSTWSFQGAPGGQARGLGESQRVWEGPASPPPPPPGRVWGRAGRCRPGAPQSLRP